MCAQGYKSKEAWELCLCFSKISILLDLHSHTLLPSFADTFLASHSVQTSPPSPLEVYVSYLKGVYEKDPFPTYDKWFPVKGREFINLSLLSKCGVSPQEAHKYTEAMFHGCISSIDPEKKMEMADIAMTEDGSIIKGRRQCILVEGAPGVGKSTFAWKLCQQWSMGEILQQYRLVVLLRLREKRVRETQNVRNLFRRREPTAIEEICRSGGEGVLLVLDGWDELPADLRGKDSFFLDLVQGQVLELEDATVVVTSRPHASEVIVIECQDRIFQHIEIMGFSEDNVQAYMRSSAGDDAKLLQGLQTYTSYYPHIRSMMYNPLNAAIVVKVYKDSWEEESIIPKTMTELYSSLIRILLLRYLKEHSVYRNTEWAKKLCDFSDLPPDVHQQLCHVSKVAYEGISNNQEVIFSDLPDDFDSLGLMQGVTELYVDEGAVKSYNFPHLTIQEFLAAFHLSQQPIEKQMEIFKLHQSAEKQIEILEDRQETSTYKMVLTFLAGLTKFRSFSSSSLLSIVTGEGETSSGVELNLDGLHFLFEGKEESIKVLNDLSEVAFCPIIYFSPFDVYVLSYIASHTSLKWAITVISYVHTISGLRWLLAADSSFLNQITQLSLLNLPPLSTCDLLCKSLPLLPNLQSLTLSGMSTVIGFNRGKPPPLFLAPYITWSSSADNERGSAGQTLSPQNTSLPPSVMSSPLRPFVQLIKALHSTYKAHAHSHNTFKSLMLFCADIGLPECEVLAHWLSSPTCSLEVLDIAGNNLPSEATELIITTLYQHCTLCELRISLSQITLLTIMFRLPLVKLDLRFCNIGPEGTCEIAGTLRGNTVLEYLNLSFNPIEDRGATALADMLPHNKTLKTLLLHQASLTAQGTKELLQSLQHNDTLRELRLSKVELIPTSMYRHKCKMSWVSAEHFVHIV